MKPIRALVLVSLVLTLTTLSFGPQEARVLRFPTVSNDADRLHLRRATSTPCPWPAGWPAS